MSEPSPSQASFGRRHPILVTVLLVFGLGFLSGAFIRPAENVLLSGIIIGLGGAAFVLVLSLIPAFVWTVVQSIRHALRPQSYDDAKVQSCTEPFHRRFMKNLDATMEFVAQGLTP